MRAFVLCKVCVDEFNVLFVLIYVDLGRCHCQHVVVARAGPARPDNMWNSVYHLLTCQNSVTRGKERNCTCKLGLPNRFMLFDE